MWSSFLAQQNHGLKKHIPLNQFCMEINKPVFNVVEFEFKSSLKMVKATEVNTFQNCFYIIVEL